MRAANPDTIRAARGELAVHGGGVGVGVGVGGFDTSLPGVGLPKALPECTGNNSGVGLLPANPMPHGEVVNALTVHFRDWVMKNAFPPPSRWPTLREGQLVEANKAAMGFPTLPGLRATLPEAGFINPVLDYDWGPDFNYNDGTGIISDGSFHRMRTQEFHGVGARLEVKKIHSGAKCGDDNPYDFAVQTIGATSKRECEDGSKYCY